MDITFVTSAKEDDVKELLILWNAFFQRKLTSIIMIVSIYRYVNEIRNANMAEKVSVELPSSSKN